MKDTAHSQGTTRPGKGGHWLACLLGVSVYALLIAGGQVTSTESGDAVPTWPFPLTLPMVGGVTWELGHRQVAGIVGILTALLAGWLFLGARGGRSPAPAWVRKTTYLSLLLVIVQAVLGGIRVLVGTSLREQGLDPMSAPVIDLIASVHACVAQAFLLMVVTVAVALSARFAMGTPAADDGVRRRAIAMTAVVYVQIVLGAFLRHTQGGLVFHLLGAAAVIVMGAILVSHVLGRADQAPWLARPAQLLGLMLLVQLGLGIAAWFMTGRGIEKSPDLNAQAVLPSLHLLAGGMILGLSHLITVRSCRTPLAAATGDRELGPIGSRPGMGRATS